MGRAADQGLLLKAQLVAQHAGVVLTIRQSDAEASALLKGCPGGVDFSAGACAALRYLAAHGSSRLYPRPPFAEEALQIAATIDSWLDFSASTVTTAVRRWQEAASAKVFMMFASSLAYAWHAGPCQQLSSG